MIQRYDPNLAKDFESTRPEKILTAGVKFVNKEESIVAKLLAKHLGLRMVDGITYQRPLDSKSRADFYLPEQKIVLEWHPIVLKWYMSKQNYSNFRRALKGIDPEKQNVLNEVMAGEIMHQYKNRRNFLMQRSHDPEMQEAKLIVCENPLELFQQIIKPFAKVEVDADLILNQFKEFKKNK